MTMFASKTPSDLNHDPEPWEDPHGDNRHGPYGGWSSTWNPRPEFDPVQHNEPNPALLELRENLAEAGSVNAKPVISIRLMSLKWAEEEHNTGWQRFTPETLAHITHARKVLTRLARLSKGN